MSHTIEARVATPSGAKYVRQLCKHWSHKMPTAVEGEGEEATGTVTFPTAFATLAADGEGITIGIAGEDRSDLERLTEVVARHVDRFAFREAPLEYVWIWRGG